jgi:CrcB protein
MREWFMVAAGGALGSVARYGLAGAIQARSASGFPFGTLVVNVTGCFAIGVLMHVGLASERGTPLRLLLVTGVLGGYTTYSAFNYETLELVRAGQAARAFAYVAATLLLGLAAGAAGLALGRAFTATG